MEFGKPTQSEGAVAALDMLNEIEHAATDAVSMVEPASLRIVERNGGRIIPIPIERTGAAVFRRIPTQGRPHFADPASGYNFGCCHWRLPSAAAYSSKAASTASFMRERASLLANSTTGAQCVP